MVSAAFFDVLEVFALIIILYWGMRFSKYKVMHIKVGGYILIVVSTLGLLVDIYNVIHNLFI